MPSSPPGVATIASGGVHAAVWQVSGGVVMDVGLPVVRLGLICTKAQRQWGANTQYLARMFGAGRRLCDDFNFSKLLKVFALGSALTPLVQTFVSHFGEMGSRWGINRTVGQIYALLFVTEQQLNADDIGELLGISRSNVSIGLKELQSWGLVRQSRVPGDRREYFASLGDVWEIFRVVAAERRRREVAPTLSVLREALLAEPTSPQDVFAQQRMREMHELVDLANNWFDELQRLSPASLAKLMKMGAKVQKLLHTKRRILGERIGEKSGSEKRRHDK